MRKARFVIERNASGALAQLRQANNPSCAPVATEVSAAGVKVRQDVWEAQRGLGQTNLSTGGG